jgi:hypothetical protein
MEPSIGRQQLRLISEMGFSEPKNPINVIGLVLPRLDFKVTFCNSDILTMYRVF